MISALSNAIGVSGCECNISEMIISELEQNKINYSYDKIGNIIVSEYNNKDSPKVLLYCGTDEYGLIVTDITDDGYLKFDTIGDIDVSSIISKRVVSDKTRGIISLKAIHLTTKDERKKNICTDDLCIDIGAANKEDAHKYVEEGDYFAFDVKYSRLGSGLAVGKALERSAAVDIMLKTIKKMSKKSNFTAIFGVQNKINARGMRVALNNENVNNADLAVFVDSLDVLDTENSLKGGPIIIISDGITPKSLKTVKDIDSFGIKTQKDFFVNCPTADMWNTFKSDVPYIALGIPCKYKQSAVGIMDIYDIEATEKLLYKIAEEAELLVSTR